MTGAVAASSEATPSLRLLFVIPGFPPVIGGAEIHVARLAEALAARGHVVEVLTMHTPPMPPLDRWRLDGGVQVSAVARGIPARWRARAFVAAAAWRIVTRRRRYDVVDVVLPGLHVVSALAAARLRGTAGTVMFGSSADVPRLRACRLGRVQLAALRRWAAGVLVLNDEMRRDFLASGVAPSVLEWLPCGVDTGRFTPPDAARREAARHALGVPADAFVVTFVGRLVPPKNLPALLEGAARLAHERPDAVLQVVGDGPDRAALEARARELAPAGAVRFRGALAGEALVQALQASDAFAMASHVEGLPCALIEAMATGLPSVVRDIPALTEVVTHGLHGLHAPGGAPAALAHALRVLRDTPDVRHAMGAEARRRALARFSREVVTSAHERVFTAAARGR